MRLPRMTTRRWMIAVAVVAVVFAAVIVCRVRSERFALIATQHGGFIPPLSYADAMRLDPVQRHRWVQEVAAWHAAMFKKYRHAARYPWLPVAPDPPMPPPPPK